MANLTPQERKVLLFVSLLFALGLGLAFFEKNTGCNICMVDIYSKKTHPVLDINTATRDEFLKLPGLSPKIADDILAYRALHGRISDLEELREVKGLSETQLKKISQYLFINK